MAARRLWLAVVLVLAGCGGAGAGESPDRLRQQARDALGRYETAVRNAGGQPRFVPVGNRIGQVGDWEAADKGDGKAALITGNIVPAGSLPAPPQPTGTIEWVGGATFTVPLVDAGRALLDLPRGDCGGCAPLEATGARLITVRLDTTRGPATVPAWEYTLRGTAVRATVPAVAASAAVTVTPPSWDPYNSPGGLAIESAATTVSGTTMTVTFTGSPGPASQPCGADYTAEAVESEHAVVVIVVTERRDDGNCTSIGARRTATVELAAPLGERAVLEVQQGLPVPVTVTP